MAMLPELEEWTPPEVLLLLMSWTFKMFFAPIVHSILLEYQNEILPKDLEMAAFILVTTAEGVVNMALLKDPQSIKKPEFEEELTDLILRYLVGSSSP